MKGSELNESGMYRTDLEDAEAKESGKPYRKMLESFREGILSGRLRPGDRLEPERELALRLGISRNSVREGLRALELIGLVTSRQGSGNFVSVNFDGTMTYMLTAMYYLKGINEEQVTEFRFCLEWEAMHLAVERAEEIQKKQVMEALRKLEEATTEDERICYDKAIHEAMVEASHNDFLITNYRALTSFMDTYVKSMRRRIIHGMESRNELEMSHRLLAEGMVEGDLEKGLRGLRRHFEFIEKYK